ncbi:MAG: VOC family protein [Candidatus Rokuibacteriota bacterium]
MGATIRLKKIGHVQLRVADLERSKAFYRDVLGFRVAEQDPNHGDLFMTLGEDFHTIDMAQHEDPAAGRGPSRPIGVAHIAFQVASYDALVEAYRALQEHGVAIERAMDHINQRSIYFQDPDGNRLEIYYEMPGALQRFPDGRGDQNSELPVTRAGEPFPGWLAERWPS